MKERNYGIDALRIVSMFMVVVLHVLGRGGVLQTAPRGSINYNAAWLLETSAYCAVNCYALISGYVGVDSKYRYKSIIYLWCRVVFYMAAITAFYYVVFPELVHRQEIINIFFPITKYQYWYFTAYAGLFIIMPLLNAAVNHMEQKQLRTAIIVGVLFFSVATTAWDEDPFKLNGGYSAWWLAILYVIGGYINRYKILEKAHKSLLLLGYILMVILSWGTKIVLENANINHSEWLMLHSELLIRYTSITILLCAIFLLLFFRNIKFPKWMQQIIKFIAPSAFSVYLIHTQPIIWINKFTDYFKGFACFSLSQEIIAVLTAALTIFLGGIMIDMIRRILVYIIFLPKKFSKKSST